MINGNSILAQSPAVKSFVADAGVSVSLIEKVTQQTKLLGGIDLAVGSPLGLPPKEIRQTTFRVSAGLNDYGDIRGVSELRRAVAEILEKRYKVKIDFERQVIVTNGATEGLSASVLALLPRNSEVIIFEPFYSPYIDVIRFCGLIPRIVQLSPANDWHFSEQDLRKAFNSRTSAIIINTPHNPTGAIFDYAAMNLIAELCLQHDVFCISDEVYDEIFYTSERPLSIVQTPAWSKLAVKIGSFSKTFAIGGWRIGYVVSSAQLTAKILSAHEVLTGGVANPMQVAAVPVGKLPERYYRMLRRNYKEKRNLLYGELMKLGFSGQLPQAGLFLTVKPPFSNIRNDEPNVQAMKVLYEAKVGIIPLGAFYSHVNSEAAGWWRVCFARRTDQVKKAARYLSEWLESGSAIKTNYFPTKNEKEQKQ